MSNKLDWRDLTPNEQSVLLYKNLKKCSNIQLMYLAGIERFIMIDDILELSEECPEELCAIMESLEHDLGDRFYD